jgi:hypothetical protein
MPTIITTGRIRWMSGLKRGCTTFLLVRIPERSMMCVSYECRVSSGRGFCDGPITRPEESYRLSCVWVWVAASTMRSRPTRAVQPWKKIIFMILLVVIITHTWTPWNSRLGGTSKFVGKWWNKNPRLETNPTCLVRTVTILTDRPANK